MLLRDFDLQHRTSMWFSGEVSPLENVFCILRFRSRGVVSFRRFIVLHSDPAHDLHADSAQTQPMRIAR